MKAVIYRCHTFFVKKDVFLKKRRVLYLMHMSDRNYSSFVKLSPAASEPILNIYKKTSFG